MRSIIRNLFFDKEIVIKLKQTATKKEMLYNHLFNGKITLEEYLAAIK